MGGCCLGGDLVPPPPLIIKPDPDVAAPIRAVTARLGFFGASRDLGVWDANEPDGMDLPKEKIWLWFNKSNTGGIAKIDLENFIRGQDPNNMNKGQVLWYASFVDRLQYQTFQRFQGNGRDQFKGFFDKGFKDFDDDHYVRHRSHNVQPGSTVKGNMITKWSMTSQASIKAGNTGRAAMLQPSSYYRLDV